MKKLFLASAVAALSVTAAQAAPTVYGKAFLTLDYVQDERTELNSNTSRIGVKGAEALTANTDLLYQLEYGVDVDADDNGKGQFYSRDTFIGLSNKQYGTFLAGRLSAIDGMVDYANVSEGGVLGGDAVQASFDAPRANNALAYVSPSYNGLTFLGMYVLDENSDTITKNVQHSVMAPGTTPGAAPTATGDYVEIAETTVGTDTLGRDAFGVGAKYEPNGANYRAGATYIQAGNFKAIRVSGAYDLSQATTVGALYQNTKYAETENAVALSVEHKYAQTPWTVYGQLDLVDNHGGTKDAEWKRLVAGGKYGFNKATTGHIYTAVGDDGDDTTFGIGAGIEYKF